MTKVVQYQADLFLILPSRYAHLQTTALGTVDQNMQDPFKSLLCFPNYYSLVLWASEIAILPSPPTPDPAKATQRNSGVYDSM